MGGYFSSAGNGRGRPEVATIDNWRGLAATFAASPATLIIAPAAILAEADWLESLAAARVEPARWAALPNRIVMLSPASARDAAETLDQDGGARDMAAVEGRLARLLGQPSPTFRPTSIR